VKDIKLAPVDSYRPKFLPSTAPIQKVLGFLYCLFNRASEQALETKRAEQENFRVTNFEYDRIVLPVITLLESNILKHIIIAEDPERKTNTVLLNKSLMQFLYDASNTCYGDLEITDLDRDRLLRFMILFQENNTIKNDTAFSPKFK